MQGSILLANFFLAKLIRFWHIWTGPIRTNLRRNFAKIEAKFGKK